MPRVTGHERIARDRVNRLRDEAVLDMLDLRLTHSSTTVAQMLGVTSEAVRITTQRVRDADLAESGEPPELVAAHYPWGRK